MFAPTSHEDLKPFIKVDNYLISKNFNAPKIYAIDEKNGFLLLEDFGDKTFTKILAQDVSNEFNYYKNVEHFFAENQLLEKRYLMDGQMDRQTDG